MLWLKWFGAFLAGAEAFAPFTKAATRQAHLWLDQIERGVFAVIILRAAPRLRLVRPARHSPVRRNETQILRAIIGSVLRRRLRNRDLRARIEALSQDIDALVARLVRRLQRGLTRRRPIVSRPEKRTRMCERAQLKRVVADDSS